MSQATAQPCPQSRQQPQHQLLQQLAVTRASMASQTMRLQSSSAQMKGASRPMAPARPCVAAFSGRGVAARVQRTAQAGSPLQQRSQQMSRSSHVVCVAAQEAPAQQQTATQVGSSTIRPRPALAAEIMAGAMRTCYAA